MSPRTDKLYYGETHPMVHAMKAYIGKVKIDDLERIQKEMVMELRNGPNRNFQLLSATIGRIIKGADVEEGELSALCWYLKTEKGL